MMNDDFKVTYTNHSKAYIPSGSEMYRSQSLFDARIRRWVWGSFGNQIWNWNRHQKSPNPRGTFKGQLISEWLLYVLNFPKSNTKIWRFSTLEFKKWSNQILDKGTLLQVILLEFDCAIFLQTLHKFTLFCQFIN